MSYAERYAEDVALDAAVLRASDPFSGNKPWESVKATPISPEVAQQLLTDEKAKSSATVNAAIIQVIFPQLYALIDDLLDASPSLPKPLVVRARKSLPERYKNSFLFQKQKTTLTE